MYPRHQGVMLACRFFDFLKISYVPVTVHFSYSLQTGTVRAWNLMTKTGLGVVRKNSLTGLHISSSVLPYWAGGRGASGPSIQAL